MKTIGGTMVGVAAGAVLGYGAGQTMSGQAPRQTVTATRTETAGSKPPVDVIKVGDLCPLTGSSGPTGQDIKRIYDMFIDDYNATGGVKAGPFKGAKINWIWSDTQSLPETSRAEAERLITQEKVHLLIGGWVSSTQLAAKQVTERYGFPLLNDASTAVTITKGANNKWFWRITPHDLMFGRVMFEFLRDLQQKKNVKVKTIGIIFMNDVTGVDMRNTIVNVLNPDPQYGGPYEIVCDVTVNTGTPTVDSELLTVKKANPDVLFGHLQSAEGILVQKGLRQYDINPKLTLRTDSTALDKRFQDAVGGLADCLANRAAWNYDINKPSSKEWDAKFVAKYGYHMFEARMLAGAQVVVKTFERLREPSLEPKVIQQTLNEMYIPAEEMIVPWGIKFYPPGDIDAGQNMLGGGIVLQYKGQSDLATVYPWDVASRELVFPVPTWKDRGL